MKTRWTPTDASVPVYQLRSFPRHEPDMPFYMTRLERLVQEIKGIDNPHAHTFYLVMWISQGSGTHTIDFKTYDITPNQLYFLTPGQVHSWKLSPDTQDIICFSTLIFLKAVSETACISILFFIRINTSRYWPPFRNRPCSAICWAMLTRNTKLISLSGADVFLSFVHILLETASRLYHQQQPGIDTHLYDRLRQYEELLEQQFLTVREVNEYASQLNLTPNYLNYICRKIVGKTASQLWQERLLIEAQRLLTHTAQSVKEIAFLTGFSDSTYFVRFFKKHTGQTPAAFRQSPSGLSS